MQKLRVFIAITPPAAWVEKLTSVQNDLKRTVPNRNVRWVDPAQIHMTLRFLGWISEDDARMVSSELHRLQQPPFELRVAGLGCFPNARRPRVLWLGLEGDLAPLERLHHSINARTAHIGEGPEDRAFTAHLTLARIKEISRSDKEALESVLRRRVELEEPWLVDKVELKRSHLSQSGSRYETLAVQFLQTTVSPG